MSLLRLLVPPGGTPGGTPGGGTFPYPLITVKSGGIILFGKQARRTKTVDIRIRVSMVMSMGQKIVARRSSSEIRDRPRAQTIVPPLSDGKDVSGRRRTDIGRPPSSIETHFRLMDPSLGPSPLVATVFAAGHLDNPYEPFRAFLHTHMVAFHTARTLKSASPEDSLVVTEYLFEFESNSDADLAALQKSAYEWSKRVGLDVAIQRDNVYRRYKRLVVFDMDSTMIKQEVIDEIANYLDSVNPEKNVGARVAVCAT